MAYTFTNRNSSKWFDSSSSSSADTVDDDGKSDNTLYLAFITITMFVFTTALLMACIRCFCIFSDRRLVARTARERHQRIFNAARNSRSGGVRGSSSTVLSGYEELYENEKMQILKSALNKMTHTYRRPDMKDENIHSNEDEAVDIVDIKEEMSSNVVLITENAACLREQANPRDVEMGAVYSSTIPCNGQCLQSDVRSCAEHEASCVICLDDYEDGMQIVSNKTCQHKFHMECIQHWLLRHRTCPYCRENMISDDDIEHEFERFILDSEA